MALNPGRITPVSNLGFAAGGQSINKFGHKPDAGTVQITCWPGGANVTYLGAAAAMTVSSAAAADTAGSTGAGTVVVYGLDANYAEVSGTVALAGTSGTATSQTFLRVTRMVVTAAGSNGTNAGSIYAGTGTLTAGVPATKYAIIAPSDCQTLQALTTIPAGVTGYLSRMQGYSDKNTVAEFELFVRPFGQVFQNKMHAHAYDSPITHIWDPPLKITQKSDIEVRVKADGQNKDISATFDIILQTNAT